MKTKHITFYQCNDVDDFYIVDSLVNRIEPQVGKVLSAAEVKQFIDLRDTKVTIKRARS